MAGKPDTTKASDTASVDDYMRALEHPLADLAADVRRTILAADKRIGEEIKWNAPAFFFTGAMAPFDPKEYRRYVAGMNLFRKDAVRVIFLRGASVDDPTGLLEGDYADGRRLTSFASVADVKRKQPALKKIVAQLIRSMTA